MSNTTSILAILVLYKMSLESCPTYCSLTRILDAHPELRDIFELRIADNSPESQIVPAALAASYVHDGGNQGLAGRYNCALVEAWSRNKTWILLLDQDTLLTASYLSELDSLSAALTLQEEVVAAVPKLVMHDQVWSPHLPAFSRTGTSLTVDTQGIQQRRVCPYNSGALVRVSALKSMGGFPEKYWLDQLDLATFHRLQLLGGKIFVMKSVLEHELSIANPSRPIDPGRHISQLTATARYYREYGTLRENLLHRLGLLRAGFGSLRRGTYADAKRLIKAALTPGPR